MSSTPPRPTAGSCARSPTSASVMPASSATVSRGRAGSWSSIPASSTTTPPAAPQGGDLRRAPDERERHASLVRHGQQGEGGVLVKHPRLVHHDPLTGGQSV